MQIPSRGTRLFTNTNTINRGGQNETMNVQDEWVEIMEYKKEQYE